jgi:hypothetical protein
MRNKLEFAVQQLHTSPNSETVRMKVYRGWIVHTTVSDKNKLSTSSAFVPDSDHIWEVVKPVKEESPPKESVSEGF